jgi:YD repeat-containing protein
VYPNYHQDAPGTRMHFWNYDPDERGWHVYGLGTVDPAGRQVVPDPDVRLYRFTGVMFSSNPSPPAEGPKDKEDGDPVDLATGLFVYRKTDLYLADTLPLALTRTYPPRDTVTRAFGIGTSHPYALFLWSAQLYQEVDLVLADGARIHYVRTSAGTGFQDAEFEHTATPGSFYRSRIVWRDHGWDLRCLDGTVYRFGDGRPLQYIRDRYGNTTAITWSQGLSGDGAGGYGRIVRVDSPHGRWIAFTYDTSDRITEAQDNLGRSVQYTYDGSGRLATVTDVASGVTSYTYDTSHRMLTITDPRGITYLTNQYDSGGRVVLQTQADSSTFRVRLHAGWRRTDRADRRDDAARDGAALGLQHGRVRGELHGGGGDRAGADDHLHA